MVGARRSRAVNATAPTPSVPNPFKELRKEDETKPSIETLAKRMGLSKQALIRLEQGVYTEPLPTAVNYFARHYSCSEYELVTNYEAFQHAVRELNPRIFGDIRALFDAEPDSRPPRHTLIVLRGTRTNTHIAKSLCTPQSSLVYWERNIAQQQSVPSHFLRCLREVGHYKSEVVAIIEHYDKFRAWYLRKASL